MISSALAAHPWAVARAHHSLQTHPPRRRRALVKQLYDAPAMSTGRTRHSFLVLVQNTAVCSDLPSRMSAAQALAGAGLGPRGVDKVTAPFSVAFRFGDVVDAVGLAAEVRTDGTAPALTQRDDRPGPACSSL